jgi:hypothetical protein
VNGAWKVAGTDYKTGQRWKRSMMLVVGRGVMWYNRLTTTGTEGLVRNPVLVNRVQAWMVVSKGVLVSLSFPTPYCLPDFAPSYIPCLYLCPIPGVIHFTLNMEAARFSKTLVSYHNTTWHHNSKDFDLNLHCCEYLRSPCVWCPSSLQLFSHISFHSF